MSIINLLGQIKNDEIVLPAIQRDFVWAEEKIARLLDSILRDYPVGIALLWETYHPIQYRSFIKDHRPGTRAIFSDNPKGQRRRVVLDGQQRLQSLYIALFGTFEGKALCFDVLSGEDQDDVSEPKFIFEFFDSTKLKHWNNYTKAQLAKPEGEWERHFHPWYYLKVSELFGMSAQSREKLVGRLANELGLDQATQTRLRVNLATFDNATAKGQSLKLSVIDENQTPDSEERKTEADVLEIFSFSTDGAWLATVNCIECGAEPYVWEVSVGKPGGKAVGNPVQFSCQSLDWIHEPEFNSDGSRFIVSTEFGNVLLFETATGRQVGTLREIGMEGQVRFSSDGKLFATSGDSARVWSAETGALLINPVHMGFTTVEFSSDGRRLLAAGGGGGSATLRRKALLDTATGYPLADVASNSFESVGAYFSPDDLLVVEEMNPVCIWNIPPTGKGPARLADLAEAVAGCALAKAGTIEVLPDRIERLTAARQAVAKLPPDDRWAQIANWFLAAPAERMISPYSKVKVSSYVQRRTKGNTKLQEAVLASPADAMARARFGVKLLADSSDPNASVHADAETLFATLLASGKSEVWQARVKVLEALKRTVEADVAKQKAASLAATAKRSDTCATVPSTFPNGGYYQNLRSDRSR